jgi:cell cycle checkpoint protein
MDSSLHQVWQAAAGSPFLPVVGKESQFTIAFILLTLSIAITGVFALSKLSENPE